MPIYAYRCESCGFEKDALQKMSDAPLTHCPQCGKDTFVKQVTAAGFQLKGSGWYVTDFRGGNNGAAAKKDDGAKAATKSEGASDSGNSGSSGSESSKSDSSTAGAAASDSSKSSTASAPAASSKPAAPASN
ncbi:FmdB family transcriptional regulator [Caballeronia mineralivorans PML1(12)]|uniref:FmdB family transcriptional regulator n=1 Tax=Caballeronia mineralivorans PML1(12) TaxID=908627 RepID=A0A0J1CQ74_9BURK|nr:FmdB family transcriptional regulator [Caballeronia mineralivorans PML1(12)]